MKVAPVSADLLIKLALAGLAVGLAVYTVRGVTGAIGDARDYIAELPARTWEGVTDTVSNAVDQGSEYYTNVHEATGLQPWQILTPATAIGTTIGTYIRKLWNDDTTRGVTGGW